MRVEALATGGDGDAAVNQAKLQKLATERLRDARALLKGKRWAYAYHVTGYAVECALKSCVLARMVHTGWVFQDKIRLEDCRTHDLKTLIGVAGLTDQLNANLKASAAAGKEFIRHWGVALQWKVESCNLLKRSAAAKSEAEELYRAVPHNPHGVLRWINNYW
jgi:HEPN domain-containing protein